MSTPLHPGLDGQAFADLRAAGDAAWTRFRARRDERFHTFIPADLTELPPILRERVAPGRRFLELGCGVGVATIAAAAIGYEAYGIELEEELVDQARALAARFGVRAEFTAGSFVPEAYRDEVALLDADFLTPTEGAPAYDEFGLELADFDLLYGYPWPGEEEWLFELVRRFAAPHAELVTYSVSEGFEVWSVAEL